MCVSPWAHLKLGQVDEYSSPTRLIPARVPYNQLRHTKFRFTKIGRVEVVWWLITLPVTVSSIPLVSTEKSKKKGFAVEMPPERGEHLTIDYRSLIDSGDCPPTHAIAA